MKTTQFEISSPNGILRGETVFEANTPLVVLCCGHNGFYNFAFFPEIQKQLAAKGISSLAFNYSHNGISDRGDYFDDLVSYEQNCRAFEVQDTLAILDYIAQDAELKENTGITLLGHSMGGFTAGFAAEKALSEGKNITALVLLCALRTLNVRTPEVMKEWQENGVYYRFNSRTKQELPQGRNFLNETLASEDEWNLQPRLEALTIPIAVAHSTDDESVPFEHGRTIFSWVYKNNAQNAFYPIPGANHTLNTSHLGERTSPALEQFMNELVVWLTKVYNN